MWLDEAMLGPVRERYGEPAQLDVDTEISGPERDLVRTSTRKDRFHDVTFFVFSGERLALIRKPHYVKGLWRPPGGGVKPGEPFEEGARREALEELGVDIELTRYLVAARAVFRHHETSIPWTTHVIAATSSTDELWPLDTQEIAEARWGSVAELQGPIRERLLATGRALWRYRVALHDAALRHLPARPPCIGQDRSGPYTRLHGDQRRARTNRSARRS
jgi:8-oxo-dGTP pyrophosphatase MutT (NUDIX family)